MNSLKILVVEDDTSVRNLITTTLKSNDYRLLSAPNGESAIACASSQQPDIVLLDLGLPDLDGVDTVEQQIDIARQKAGIGPKEAVKLERFEVVRHQ